MRNQILYSFFFFVSFQAWGQTTTSQDWLIHNEDFTAEVKISQEVVIDLGHTYNLKGFTYWPIQERCPFGIITNYEFSTSANGRNWKTVAQGEFSNIVNSRLEQTVNFEKTKARYQIKRCKGRPCDGLRAG